MGATGHPICWEKVMHIHVRIHRWILWWLLRGRSLRRGRCRQHTQSECVSNTRGCHSRDWCAVLGSRRRGLLCLRCHSNRGIVSAARKQRATESVGYSRMASWFRFPFARQPKEPSAEEILRERAPYWSQCKAPHRFALRRLEKSTGRARFRREPEKSSGLRRSFAISVFLPVPVPEAPGSQLTCGLIFRAGRQRR